jgi:hypothetical protein
MLPQPSLPGLLVQHIFLPKASSFWICWRQSLDQEGEHFRIWYGKLKFGMIYRLRYL